MKTKDKPGTTLKRTTKSSLLSIWFLFEVYSDNFQQDTTTCYLSLISVFIRRVNCVVFPVLYQCFHGVPNKKGTISINPIFLGINALYVGTATSNFTGDICISHLTKKKCMHSYFVLKVYFLATRHLISLKLVNTIIASDLLLSFAQYSISNPFFLALERSNDLKGKTQTRESQRITQQTG